MRVRSSSWTSELDLALNRLLLRTLRKLMRRRTISPVMRARLEWCIAELYEREVW